jgi:hypothetical protein
LDVLPIDETTAVQVVPVIDDRSLVEIVGEYETTRGYEPAGGYGGLVPSFFRFGKLDRYFLGEQEPWIGGIPIAVLACDCGELGCWPLQVSLEITAGDVTWRELKQPHRPQWDYSDLGPFIFDRDQYEVAVRAAAAALGRGND